MKSFKKTAPAYFLLLSAALLTGQSLQAEENPSPLLQTCSACHGQTGISKTPEYPNLAAQKPEYLAQQIRAFRDGERDNPAMSAVVKSLSDADIKALAAYYSRQSPANSTATEVSMAGKHVRARCISCHGMDGNTVNREWPNLAGQHAQYLQKQLQDFKSGARPSPIMSVIANELSDQEISDVSTYYSQL